MHDAGEKVRDLTARLPVDKASFFAQQSSTGFITELNCTLFGVFFSYLLLYITVVLCSASLVTGL